MKRPLAAAIALVALTAAGCTSGTSAVPNASTTTVPSRTLVLKQGGTVTVDRERDLALSAQALLAVEEIDDALAKMRKGRYGVCEGCGDTIVKARLEALPYARLCIACKAGGLSRR